MKTLSLIQKTTLIFLVALLGLTEKGTAQPYQSFFGENSTVYSIFIPLTVKKSMDSHSNFLEKSHISKSDSVLQGALGPGSTFEFTVNRNDTITIDNNLYFVSSSWHGSAHIREDTNTGQLFRYYKGTEHLICDMSLAVGDTFTFPTFGDNYYDDYYNEQGATTTVDSIRYLNGRKVIYFQGLSENVFSPFYGEERYYSKYFTLCFVEGIGPMYGTWGYIRISGETYLGVILCVKKDDTLTYMTSPLLGCYQERLSIQETEVNPLKIFPNPVIDKLKIEISDPDLLFGKVIIVDALGREVYSKESFSVSDEIPVNYLPSGIYILQYIVKDKVYQSKFIKQ